MTMKIGLYGGGFKPLTKGHFEVIQRASKENDLVKLYVSTGDRIRKNEHPIFWSDMEQVWKRIIEKSLPKNVQVFYVPAPIKPIVQNALELTADSDDVLTVYADPEDMDNIFYQKRLEKLRDVITSKKLNLIKLVRGSDTSNISGTMMRKFLELGLKDNFIKSLPAPLRKYGSYIFIKLNGFTD